MKKDLELKLKEDMLKRRESLESKMEEVRGSQRERDRELDKRESQLEEQQESIRKKEKMLQGTQPRSRINARRAAWAVRNGARWKRAEAVRAARSLDQVAGSVLTLLV